jgi:multimeric flavodoxin WrbA
MQVLSIIGSPFGEKGNTGKLLSEVVKTARALGANCDIVSLSGENVKFCTGCNLCHKKGFCHLDDDFEIIKKKMIGADAIILATPNYIFHVSAQMKAFIDRCAALIHTMALDGKYGASVVTSGGGDEMPIIDYLNHFMTVLGIMPVDATWSSMGTTNDTKLTENMCNEAHRVGKNLVEAWKNKIKSNATSKLQNMHRERMLKLVDYYKDKWTYEYEYWQKKGLLPY